MQSVGNRAAQRSQWRRMVGSLLAVALPVLFQPAFAQVPGAYAGVGLARSSADIDGGALGRNLLDRAAAEGIAIASIASSEDDTDTALKLFLGYRFNPYLALEGALVDLGDFEARAAATDVKFGETLSVTTDIDFFALSFAGLGHVPLGRRASVYAKLGLFLWDLDLQERERLNGFGITGIGRESEDGTDLFYGAGIEWGLTRQFALRAEWERYNDVGEGSIAGETDIDVAGISAVFRW